MKNSLFIAVLLFSFLGVFGQRELTPVPAGSKVHFSIKNFGISTGGDVEGLKGKIVINPMNPTASSADVTVDVSTIDTDNEKRDRHLQADDFFDAARYPQMRIVSTSITKGTAPGSFTFNGKLTIKDVTGDISFPFTAVPQDKGYLLAGEFSIDRLKYHVGGESKTMGDNIDITLNIVAQ